MRMLMRPMGLSVYFFQHDEWLRLYNCSFYSVEDLPLNERQHRKYSVLMVFFFVAIESMYIPCLYAMCKRNLRQAFCYRLMIQMGVIDVLSLPITTLLPAIYSWNGWMYCTHPRFMYLVGCWVFPLWIGYTTAGMILALNRCSSLTNSHLWLFKDSNYQKCWLLLPVIALLVTLFLSSAMFYNPLHGAWFFDPHLGYYEDPEKKYVSYAHSLNNVVFASVVLTAYMMCFVRQRLLNKMVKQKHQQAHNRQLFIQVFIVNSTICGVVFIYTMMQYFTVPQICITLSQVAWVLVEGAPPVIYLTMNKAIRRNLFEPEPRSATISRPQAASVDWRSTTLRYSAGVTFGSTRERI